VTSFRLLVNNLKNVSYILKILVSNVKEINFKAVIIVFAFRSLLIKIYQF